MADVAFLASLWLIGCGNMAGAMLRRWLDVGVDPASVTVIRPSGTAVAEGVRVVTALPDEPGPTVALLGVKPQKLDEVSAAYRDKIGVGTVLVSILAGVDGASLRARFRDAGAIIRAMPNTPVAVGKGTIALCGGDPRSAQVTEALMQPLGLVEWVDEALLDVVAALTASGPAFVYRFIDALAAGATGLGLSPEQAQRLAIAMTEGAASLAAQAEVTPDQLAERVASPGGMTREGLNMLDNQAALDRLVARTLSAAVQRSREMGEQARRR
jgi:pyrroline-5-carboxylate reductase